MSVLIIEDDPDSLELLDIIMKEADLDPLKASGGKEGLALLKKHYRSIELLLLDLMMPEIDGFEVLRVMSREEDLSEIPVIVVTALDDPENVERAFEMGAFEYVAKPYDSLSLIARTKAAIRFSRTRMELKQKNRALSELLKEVEAQKDMLDENLNYMDTLIDILDHKIKNKLVPVISYSETFMNNVGGGNAEYAFGVIHSASIQLNETIEDILTDMRARTRTLGKKERDVDIRGLLSGIVQKNAYILRDRGMQMSIDVEEDVPEEIITDITLFYDILDNLISNAIKYTEEGGIIRVHCYISDKEGHAGEFGISVEDNGMGIPSEYIDRVFEKEFIVPLDGYVRKENRTGMGLYLVRKFVSALGGSIEVSSILGKGTRFEIHLPLRIPDQSSVV